MIKRNAMNWMVYGLVIIALGLAAGCGVKTVKVWGDPATGLILTYRLPKDQVLKYKSTSEQTESMDMMGQMMVTKTDGTNEFSVRLKGMDKNDLQLEVTINSWVINIDSAQGFITGDMSNVIGRPFAMVLSPLGRELDVSEAEALEYDLGAAGRRSIASGFQAIFPDVPNKPVKLGNTWESEDTITDQSAQADITIHLKNLHTLEGFETVNGMECAKIRTKVSGTIEGTGEQQGVGLTFSGTYGGTDIWYFAYKEGVFVKVISDGLSDVVVTVDVPGGMTVPVTQEMSTETNLVK